MRTVSWIVRFVQKRTKITYTREVIGLSKFDATQEGWVALMEPGYLEREHTAHPEDYIHLHTVEKRFY